MATRVIFMYMYAMYDKEINKESVFYIYMYLFVYSVVCGHNKELKVILDTVLKGKYHKSIRIKKNYNL